MFAPFDLVEFFKDLVELILRDANPCVSNFVKDMIPFSVGSDRDLTSIRSKLKGVEKEVDEDVMEPSPVGIDEEV